MNYYNENNPAAATWLRGLIDESLIPPGYVDTRSIADVSPADLGGFTQCHFFAGIAGWPLALSLAGWPAGRPCWTGSCPCQPFSVAGKGRGEADERHLWPEFLRLIAACNPPVAIGEQVASASGRNWLAGIRSDLEALGYAFGSADLCAAGVHAPHPRQRLFWVADSTNGGLRQKYPLSGRSDEGDFKEGKPAGFRMCGTTCGMGNAGQQGLEGTTRFRNSNEGWQKRLASGAIGGLVHPYGNGCQPWSEAATGSRYGDSSDSAGFWTESRWIECRDGKFRRIPSEPDFQFMASRIPFAMGPDWHTLVEAIQTKINHRASTFKANSHQVLRAMLVHYAEENLQGNQRGAGGLLEKAILLIALRELAGKMGGVEKVILQGIDSKQGGALFSMPSNPCEQPSAACSSQGWELEKQLRIESENIVHELSYENTQFKSAVLLLRGLGGFPLSSRLPYKLGNRRNISTPLIHGAGNAIVPQVAAVFVRAFMEATDLRGAGN